MSVYLYKCPIHDEFEVEHSMHELLQECPKCKEEGKEHPEKVTRLIAGGTQFTLIGGSWGRDNYK